MIGRSMVIHSCASDIAMRNNNTSDERLVYRNFRKRVNRIGMVNFYLESSDCCIEQ